MATKKFQCDFKLNSKCKINGKRKIKTFGELSVFGNYERIMPDNINEMPIIYEVNVLLLNGSDITSLYEYLQEMENANISRLIDEEIMKHLYDIEFPLKK